MANFHPARRAAGMASGKTDMTRHVLNAAEQRQQRLGYRRHGCNTFVFFVTLFVWVVAFAGMAWSVELWAWYGLLILVPPLLLSLFRRTLADEIFKFTIRNDRTVTVEDGDQP